MKKVLLTLLCALPCILATTAPVQADNTFLVQVFGAEDLVAPTASTLTATVIANDQIDIEWSTSTDNYLVSGYVLFRNGSPIATTSQTNYSDGGLVASTTYTYFVKAFDPSFNYSLSSNIATVTTPGLLPQAEDGDSGGTASRVVLNNLQITPTEKSARFEILTARPARFEIRWGRTNSYELGYTVNDSYVSSYATNITDLEPGTVYEYEIIGYTPLGNTTVLERGQFTTKSFQDSIPPANVSNFKAVVKDTDVALSWVLPQGVEMQYVRVLRSHLGFPSYIQDGVIVYQGLGQSVLDKAALSQYSPAYYTAFVVDRNGNVSSGAIARVYIPASDEGDGVIQPPIHHGGDGTAPDTMASTSATLPPGTILPTLDEIFVRQYETTLSFLERVITLDGRGSFLISIPSDAIFDTVKLITVTLTNPSNEKEVYSYLLRMNKDKTAYEAVLPALFLEGKSRVTIDIYDQDMQHVATYQKSITLSATEKLAKTEPLFPDMFLRLFKEYGLFGSLPLLILLLLFFYRRYSTRA